MRVKKCIHGNSKNYSSWRSSQQWVQNDQISIKVSAEFNDCWYAISCCFNLSCSSFAVFVPRSIMVAKDEKDRLWVPYFLQPDTLPLVSTPITIWDVEHASSSIVASTRCADWEEEDPILETVTKRGHTSKLNHSVWSIHSFMSLITWISSLSLSYSTDGI